MKDTDKALLWMLVTIVAGVAIYAGVRVHRRAKSEPVRASRTVATQTPSKASPMPAPTAAPAETQPGDQPPSPIANTRVWYPPGETPGSIDPRVTQSNIRSTICAPGYTKSVRPPSTVSRAIKSARMAELELPGDEADYQLDHVVPLELGGCPDCETNLWMEPYPDAIRKDHVERYLHSEVCAGRMGLEAAQTAIMQDWYAIYLRRFHDNRARQAANRVPWD